MISRLRVTSVRTWPDAVAKTRMNRFSEALGGSKVPDLSVIHHPRVVAGNDPAQLRSILGVLPDPLRRNLRRAACRFTVLVENASELIWASSSQLTTLGVVAVPLPQLEGNVERYLIAGLADDIEPGLCPLSDMLRRTIDNYLTHTFDWLDRIKGVPTPPVRTLIMGVLNVTADSFSDGGIHADADSAVVHAIEMIEAGAHIIDVGGASTRPRSSTPTKDVELERTIPVIEKLRSRTEIPISIDTTNSLVADAALDAGANIINDVTALSGDPDMGRLAATRDVPVVLMHMKGTPRTMQEEPHYDDFVAETFRYLSDAVVRAESDGIKRHRIAIDPGFGFGKTVQHNLEMLRRLCEYRSLGCPILIGTSRKSTIGEVIDKPVNQRVLGTAATTALAVAAGAAIVRVHDVDEAGDVVRMSEAILGDAI